MGRSSTVTDTARKKEYWEDDFEAIKNKVGERPIEKLPLGNLRMGSMVAGNGS